MILNEIALDKIISEVINETFNSVAIDYKRIDDVPNGQHVSMPSDEKRDDRYKEYKTCQNIRYDNKYESMAAEACNPKGLMFDKGAILKRILDRNKMTYSIPVNDFLRFVKNKYPDKKISKKLIPRKRERNQLDDVEYYNLIINLI